MLGFDVMLVLRVSSSARASKNGDSEMSDEWIAATVKRIKQSEEEKRQKENYALLRERKFSSHQDKLFEELQTIFKETIAKLNEQFSKTEKRFDIKTRYDEIQLTGPRELSFDIKQDSNSHELTLALWQGNSQQASVERTVPLDLNEAEEVRYVWDKRPISVRGLAETLLELLINYSL